jgi:signal transduction histidine kinase
MDKELKHRIHQAHDNILTLGDLVNQLTVLSDIESQNLKLDIGEVDIHELFQELKYQNGYEAQAKGLKFVVDLPNDVGSFYSSQFYIEIILKNILTNAISYTTNGQVTLSAKNSDDRQYILISVKDSGEGMDEHEKIKLFTKFYRSEDYTKKHTRGAGLGLYISKKIASLLNIDLTFESKLNEGTTFYLKIPINRQ